MRAQSSLPAYEQSVWVSVENSYAYRAQYTITAGCGEGGTISPSGAVQVEEGKEQEFHIAASDGYEIADLLVDGVSQGPLAQYTFQGVSAHHTIQASFRSVQSADGTTPTTGENTSFFLWSWLLVLGGVAGGLSTIWALRSRKK